MIGAPDPDHDTLTLKTYYFADGFATKDVADQMRSQVTDDYDTLVGTGLSGALVIPPLAEALGKKWLVVRKPEDGSHASYPAEGQLGRRWIFVDDLISSGKTKRRVLDAVATIVADGWRNGEWETAYVGDYLYNDGGEWHYADPQRSDRLPGGTKRNDDLVWA